MNHVYQMIQVGVKVHCKKMLNSQGFLWCFLWGALKNPTTDGVL